MNSVKLQKLTLWKLVLSTNMLLYFWGNFVNWVSYAWTSINFEELFLVISSIYIMDSCIRMMTLRDINYSPYRSHAMDLFFFQVIQAQQKSFLQGLILSLTTALGFTSQWVHSVSEQGCCCMFMNNEMCVQRAVVAMRLFARQGLICRSCCVLIIATLKLHNFKINIKLYIAKQNRCSSLSQVLYTSLRRLTCYRDLIFNDILTTAVLSEAIA